MMAPDRSTDVPVAPRAAAALDGQLRAALDHALQVRAMSTPVPGRLWGHRPEIARRQVELLTSFYEHSCLDERLRELVRLRVAAFNDCAVCQLARKSDEVTDDDVACLAPDNERFTLRERAALRFADLLVVDHLADTTEVFEQLHACFDEAEIVELGMFTVAMLGNGRLAHVLQVARIPDEE